jgi:hypothetical protein
MPLAGIRFDAAPYHYAIVKVRAGFLPRSGNHYL